jgi:hypothetical protein
MNKKTHKNKSTRKTTTRKRTNKTNKTNKTIRVKMLCNWSSSKELCDEWKVMCEKDYKWKNIEITWEDKNIDYYVIINYPKENHFYIPNKTIIFQMEPLTYSRKWGKWSNPDPNKFLFVGAHKQHLNNVQVQFKKLPLSIPSTNRLNKAMIILSEKNDQPGHNKRINFLKKTQTNLIDVYGRKNYHKLKNYKGVVPNDNKEDLFVQYKYSFNAENNWEHNYATEKIWEPIVCENLCFYWGCPNLEEYIDPRAFVRLNLADISGSLKIIEKAIQEDWWSQRIDVIRKEKEKILTKLFFFPRIQKIIENDKKRKRKTTTKQ